MRSAATLFSDRGMELASIDEVAEHAGFTKGAFYANFESKEQLFLAMLDARFAERLEEIGRAVGSEGEPEDQARQAGIDFDRSARSWWRAIARCASGSPRSWRAVSQSSKSTRPSPWSTSP